MRKLVYLLVLVLVAVSAGLALRQSPVLNKQSKDFQMGDVVDSFNGVYVYYNGHIDHTEGRNLAPDGYNLGLKYQCVEFVKRYYYQHLKHKMPDTYGNAVDFFDKNLADGAYNKRRDLVQYKNPGKSRPEVNDLIVFDGCAGNSYGHVAIVCSVNENGVEIIQQNPGIGGSSRVHINLDKNGSLWELDQSRILGWLRKE